MEHMELTDRSNTASATIQITAQLPFIIQYVSLMLI